MVPVNILGDGYPNKTIGYLNIIIKCVMFTSLTVIINDEELIITSTRVVISSSKYDGKNYLQIGNITYINCNSIKIIDKST